MPPGRVFPGHKSTGPCHAGAGAGCVLRRLAVVEAQQPQQRPLALLVLHKGDAGGMEGRGVRKLRLDDPRAGLVIQGRSCSARSGAGVGRLAVLRLKLCGHQLAGVRVLFEGAADLAQRHRGHI